MILGRVPLMTLTILAYAITCIIALTSALAVYVLLLRIGKTKPSVTPQISSSNAELTFLFAGHTLVSATTPAERLLATQQQDDTDWNRFLRLMDGRFPSLGDDASALCRNQKLRLSAIDNPDSVLEIEKGDGELRVTLLGPDSTDIAQHHILMEREALQGELTHLRAIALHAPQLIWQENKDGRVTWGNSAYLRYSDKMSANEARTRKVWPAHRIFKELLVPSGAKPNAIQSRHSLCLSGENAEHWFDVTTIPFEDGALHYAADANATVRAEQSQKAFMQNLGQTFAQLSVGLAIFDRYRQLTTFNPSLLELTGLSFAFLGGRPSLDMFLDRLRETRKLPEPKDYADWKEQFKSLEADAKNGSYVDTWTLPDGQMLRVTGRPHPDGAIAFLFEDISAEVSLTRRFRTEIETGQAVLDSFDEAVAVFSAANTLVIMNDAYVAMWGTSASDIDGNLDLRSALRIWKSKSAPTPTWRMIEEFAAAHGEREEWSEHFVLNDGRSMCCRASPIPGGMMLVRFEQSGKSGATIDNRDDDQNLVALKG